LKRNKVNPDSFWLRDSSLEDSANLPGPDVIAQQIAEELQAAFYQFGNDTGGSEVLMNSTLEEVAASL
jgi:type I restriction enzyme M protein